MTNKELISRKKLEEKIDSIRIIRDNLKREQAKYRVQESRLKKLLNDLNQLELDLCDDPNEWTEENQNACSQEQHPAHIVKTCLAPSCVAEYDFKTWGALHPSRHTNHWPQKWMAKKVSLLVLLATTFLLSCRVVSVSVVDFNEHQTGQADVCTNQPYTLKTPSSP